MIFMSLKSETIVFRVCGNCAYAKGSSLTEDIEKLEDAYLECINQHAHLIVLRRQANHLKDATVVCRKENAEMSVFEASCAFWKKK